MLLQTKILGSWQKLLTPLDMHLNFSFPVLPTFISSSGTLENVVSRIVAQSQQVYLSL